MTSVPLRTFFLGSLLTLPALSTATASVIVLPRLEVFEWNVEAPIPDNDAIGLADVRRISGSGIGFITSLSVSLELRDGFNGDLYAFLSHDSGFSVLLNRPGRTAANLAGSSSSGFDVTFANTALLDIHTAILGSGVVTGFFQPDARAVDPTVVLDTSERTAFLDSFDGLDANGDWTLFLADIGAGDESTLVRWGLIVEGLIPEPSSALLVALGALGLIIRRRRAG